MRTAALAGSWPSVHMKLQQQTMGNNKVLLQLPIRLSTSVRTAVEREIIDLKMMSRSVSSCYARNCADRKNCCADIFSHLFLNKSITEFRKNNEKVNKVLVKYAMEKEVGRKMENGNPGM